MTKQASALTPDTKCKLYLQFGIDDGISKPYIEKISVFHGVRIKNIPRLVNKRMDVIKTHITVGSKRKKEKLQYFVLDKDFTPKAN